MNVDSENICFVYVIIPMVRVCKLRDLHGVGLRYIEFVAP